MSTPALNPLVEKIRGKYPGAYDDMDDAALTKAILAKYPQYSDLAAPPMAKPSVKMDTGEGPIAAGMTSFETQLSKVPAATGQFLKSAAQGFPEDTAAHNRVLAGQADPVDELKNALQKLNPIVSNSEGIDYGATAANLLPVLLGLKKGNISEAASTIKSGAESVLEHPVTKAIAKTADVASFERFSKAYELWKNLPAEIRARTPSPVYPGAPLPEHPGIFPGAPLPEHPGVFPGAPYPDNPGVFPGAPMPETPSRGLMQASSLSRGPKAVVDPAAGLGSIPVSKSALQQAVVEMGTKTPMPTIRARALEIQQQLNKSLGAQELKPNVPLRDQMSAKAPEAPKLPEGFTPVDSSALKGAKYDPETKQFEAITPNGWHYVWGDVEPEVAAKFEAADSKGKAWNELRNAPGVTLIKKGPVGRVTSVKPTSKASASPEDLTEALQNSLEKALSDKAKRAAAQ